MQIASAGPEIMGQVWPPRQRRGRIRTLGGPKARNGFRARCVQTAKPLPAPVVGPGGTSGGTKTGRCPCEHPCDASWPALARVDLSGPRTSRGDCRNHVAETLVPRRSVGVKAGHRRSEPGTEATSACCRRSSEAGRRGTAAWRSRVPRWVHDDVRHRSKASGSFAGSRLVKDRLSATLPSNARAAVGVRDLQRHMCRAVSVMLAMRTVLPTSLSSRSSGACHSTTQRAPA
jgi:hypothetical protein